MNFKVLPFIDKAKQAAPCRVELCNQIAVTMADLGYDPPRGGEPFETAAAKILTALLDLQKRVST